VRYGAAASRRRTRTHHKPGYRRARQEEHRSHTWVIGLEPVDMDIAAPAESLTPLHKEQCQSEQPCAWRTRGCLFDDWMADASTVRGSSTAAIARAERTHCHVGDMRSAMPGSRQGECRRGVTTLLRPNAAPNALGKYDSGRQELISSSAPVRRTDLQRVAGPSVSRRLDRDQPGQPRASAIKTANQSSSGCLLGQQTVKELY
jgi:hypothetical protein